MLHLHVILVTSLSIQYTLFFDPSLKGKYCSWDSSQDWEFGGLENSSLIHTSSTRAVTMPHICLDLICYVFLSPSLGPDKTMHSLHQPSRDRHINIFFCLFFVKIFLKNAKQIHFSSKEGRLDLYFALI